MPCVDPIPELKREPAAEIGALVGTDQPRVSDLRRGKLDRFSLEMLIRFLARLRQHVEHRITAERIGPATRATTLR